MKMQGIPLLLLELCIKISGDFLFYDYILRYDEFRIKVTPIFKIVIIIFPFVHI